MKPVKIDKHILLGAHMSTAGGLYTAFERADAVGCTAIQIFTKNSNQWKDPELSVDDIKKYLDARNKSKVGIVVSHDSYLINLCAADESILARSRYSFTKEIMRCHALGIDYLVFHPGAHTTRERKEGILLVSESLNEAHESTRNFKVMTLIETTAGQGTTVGSSFEEIAEMISHIKDVSRVGVCLDTCHIFASGYDIRTRETYRATMDKFGEIIGFDKLHAIHLNDAKKPLGSRVDRHEHIGKGEIGKTAFGFIMNDKRFSRIPKLLETPKGEDGYTFDIKNIKTLLSLVK
ncbi:MAG TPA: deoxyribonuclease IV [Candidatus Kryptonia bacterium]